jgi:hypothetical protein
MCQLTQLTSPSSWFSIVDKIRFDLMPTVKTSPELFGFRFMMTARTLINLEGVLAIVAAPTIFTGLQVIHGYLDRSLLHLGEHFRIVAVGTG